jgi:hypothetical protein
MAMQKVPVRLSPTGEEDMKRYLRRRILGLEQAHKELFETRAVRWRKQYEAEPAQQIRTFPFENASNLVIPITAIHVDTLLARVMSSVIKTKPIWVANILGDHPDLPNMIRDDFESFLQYCALEPSELDIYRVYHEWFAETIKFGSSVVKCPWVRETEDEVTAGDGSGRYEYNEKVSYAGPRPEKIPFSDFLVSNASKTLQGADFKAHILHYQKHQLEELAFKRIYDREVVKKVLTQPDRTSPSTIQTQAESDAGIHTSGAYGFTEWDIHECWIRYKFSGHYVKMIVWYHEMSNQILRIFFNYYPDEPFVMARLFYRDDMLRGYGFCEMLEMMQEEVSVIHNQRRDNSTVCNMSAWRVNPDSKLHKGYRIFPSAMVPAEDGEISPLACGIQNAIPIQEEEMALQLAERRTGVSPPSQGMGAGGTGKGGKYNGAMGTLAIMQDGNTRTDLNTTDMRYSHTILGRIIARQYAYFGTGDRLELFGQKTAESIQKALDGLRSGKLALPIYASSASINREVEKQNDMMLTGVMARHYQMVAQMIQASQNPMLPDPAKQYAVKCIESAEKIMKTVMRHFGYDDIDRLVPEAPVNAQQQPQQGPQLPPGGPPQTAPLPANGGGSPGGLASTMAALRGGKPQ